MKVSRNQQGIAHVLVLVLIMAVVGATAFAGYRVVKSNEANTDTTVSDVHSTAVPKKIQSKNDLSKADNALDNTTIESSVDPNQLNSDLNAIQ
jgi:hypothetical protein